MSDFLSELSAHPNDAYFKAVFSRPEQASAFFQHHLPQPLAEAIDWDSLTAVPASFVKQSLQQAHSDLLFSAKMGKGADSRQVMLYLLFEHQTSVDAAMPLRLLGYMLSLWQVHQRQHGLPLPPILPFVLHQGPDAWTVSTHFEDLLDLPEELAPALLPYLPKFTHALLDLSLFDPVREEQQAQMRVILQLMKLARQKQVLEFFEWLATLPDEVLPASLLRLSLMYALHVDSRLDVKKIYRTLEANPSLQEKTMSVAEQLIAQGKAEGISQGLSQGISRGKMEGKLQLLEELMGMPVSSSEDLAELGLEALQSRFQALQMEYETRFKKR